jgi:hypothetical protein
VTPAEQVRAELAAARAAGMPFAETWGSAVEHAASLSAHADEWRSVFGSTRPAWERAYTRTTPTRRERAALTLAEGEPADLDARRCAWCDEAIPPTLKRLALYCGPECKRLANQDGRGRGAVGDDRRRVAPRV